MATPGPSSHSNPRHAGASTFAAEATAGQARAQLTANAVYDGIITAMSDDGYAVQLANPRVVVNGCRNAMGIIAPMLGFQIRGVIPIGTNVKVVYGSPSFVIAGGGPSRSGTPEPMPITERGMLEGEFAIGHSMGGMIQFLTAMARLSAGDRASVETFLHNDLVRITCEAFQNFSAFGELEILPHNGRVDMMWRASGYEHETWGMQRDGDPKVEMAQEFEVAKAAAEAGRFRAQAFMGYLGDFLNLVVHDPADALGTLAQEYAGKARVHIGQDGTFLMQSVSEIALEQVFAIPVPRQMKDLRDPELAKQDYSTLDKKYLGIIAALQTAGTSSLPSLAYHLREYARWLGQAHSWQRFLQLGAETFAFESEAVATQRQPPTADCGETDKQTAGAAQPLGAGYSTIRIMRDGDILMYEGQGGAAVLLSKGQVRLSGINIEIEASNDVRLIAGGNVWLTGRRNVEISALTGALVTVGRTAWRALCSWGQVHLRSDADPAAPKTQTDQPNGAEDPLVEWDGQALPVLLEASQAGVCLSGKKDHQVVSEEGGVSIQAPGEIRVSGLSKISLTVKNGLHILADQYHLLGKRANLVFSDFFSINRVFVQTPRALFVRGVTFVQSLVSRGGIEGPAIGPQPRTPDELTNVGMHLNHILPNNRAEKDQTHGIPDEALQVQGPSQVERPHVQRAQMWKLPPRSEHRGLNIPPQSLSQAFAEDNDAGFHSMKPADVALSADRMGDNLVPFFGPRTQEYHLTSGLPPLHRANDVAAHDIADAAQGLMQAREMAFRYLRRI